MKDVVREYYNAIAEKEDNRLKRPYNLIEYNVTLDTILTHIVPGGTVFDIGCGTGAYAIPLLQKGYQVALLDLSDEEIALVQKKLKTESLSPLFVTQGNALNLEPYMDRLYDGILVLGPMYHIPKKEDRMKVLMQLHSLLKKDGVAVIAYINSYGLLRTSITEFQQEFVDEHYVDQILAGSITVDNDEGFTLAYFSSPEDAKKEIIEAGFTIKSIVGAESFLSGMQDQMTKMHSDNIENFNAYIEAAKKVANQPHYNKTTEHILFVIKK